MKIKLLEIDKYIEDNKILEVTSIKAESSSGRPDAAGRFSEEIFGRIGSPERRKKFGFIDLGVKIIHPEAWDIFVGISPDIKKIALNKKNYIIGSNGELIEDQNGNSGINFLITNFDKLNLSVIGKFRPKRTKFIKQNKNLIFINRMLVLPAGIRDIQISQSTGRSWVQHSEINQLYQELISQTKIVPENPDMMPEDLIASIVGAIQRKVNTINDWIKTHQLKGKTGLIRGGMLNKTVDYSGRLYIVGDPTLKLGFIGLPWQVCLKLYEPFFENFIFKSSFSSNVAEIIRDFLGEERELDTGAIKRFLSSINENPEAISPLLKDELIKVAEDIVKDKIVIYKRDPVECRDSWLAGYIRVDKTGFILKINPLDCPRLGADFDGNFNRLRCHR